MKKHNPNVPVLIREAFGVPAKVFARYGMLSGVIDVEFGLERKVSLDGMSEKECEDTVERLIKTEAAGKADVL
jgi:NADH dehydrogenase (ubiquinone) 1 alpha subcomplex subunit 2